MRAAGQRGVGAPDAPPAAPHTTGKEEGERMLSLPCRETVGVVQSGIVGEVRMARAWEPTAPRITARRTISACRCCKRKGHHTPLSCCSRSTRHRTG